MKVLRPSNGIHNRLTRHQLPLPPRRRTFLTLPQLPTQNLTASRTLKYPAPEIYAIIADVPSYSAFLPYCTESQVTAWSRPDSNGKKWPSEAKITVGFKGFQESFTSKIYCAPGSIVEAVGGGAKTGIPDSELGHYDLNTPSEKTSNDENGILTHLLTRWSVRPFPFKPPPREGSALQGTKHTVPEDRTEVTLNIEFQFSNPVYSAMSGAVADRVAGVMIEAFEKRVGDVLGGDSASERVEKNGMEGVVHRGESP
ncbi:hypothetical protein EJ08DRAFT_646073 [Tothia fuscella]|uniref:Coenzyme Q-binding protein COQ10 START domain-containing protein n=1 Tax=Tothia fuscella TaxID=1048955 RepID=A0A9P4U3M8_9PEZI|nr:hypothetical protein EJ08DRAFT_646073 [Tothia fuscella]